MKKLISLIAIMTFSFTAFVSAKSNNDILKEGLLGAGTGAIAAEASGGKAGKGALVGAGTNIIGGILLDSLTGSGQQQQQAPPPQQQVYYQQAPIQQPVQQVDPYQEAYNRGFQDGYRQGYRDGYREAEYSN